jgi:hypothetical protein
MIEDPEAVRRMLQYVTDDGAVAAYFGIPRVVVAKMRGATEPTRGPRGGMTPSEIEAVETTDSPATDMIKRRKEGVTAAEKYVARCEALFVAEAERNGWSVPEAKNWLLRGHRPDDAKLKIVAVRF